MMETPGLPSAADLDAVAQEERTRELTAGFTVKGCLTRLAEHFDGRKDETYSGGEVRDYLLGCLRSLQL